MDITREEARQIFIAGSLWEQNATAQNFNDIWDQIQPKLKSSSDLLEALQSLIDPLTGLVYDSVSLHIGIENAYQIEQAIEKALK